MPIGGPQGALTGVAILGGTGCAGVKSLHARVSRTPLGVHLPAKWEGSGSVSVQYAVQLFS